MTLDVVDLREFYVSPLGQLVRKALRERLAQLWPNLRGETILALGYGTPLLRPWVGQAQTLLAMMPPEQGVAFWPREGPNISCLADLTQLPLPDNTVDRIVLVHALETATTPETLLEEVWRVLKPNGRAILIVPNRRSFWAQSESTPFGVGQPYSSSQLRQLVKDQGFLLEKTSRALFAPPLTSRLGLAIAATVEKYGPKLFPAFGGGVLMMEVCKQLYTPLMVKSRNYKRRLVLPVPFPTSPLPSNRGNP